MCELCRFTHCPSNCPNAPEPPKVFVCSGCGDPIREGDDYWDVMGEQFCEKCIDNAKREAEYDPY